MDSRYQLLVHCVKQFFCVLLFGFAFVALNILRNHVLLEYGLQSWQFIVQVSLAIAVVCLLFILFKWATNEFGLVWVIILGTFVSVLERLSTHAAYTRDVHWTPSVPYYLCDVYGAVPFWMLIIIFVRILYVIITTGPYPSGKSR